MLNSLIQHLNCEVCGHNLIYAPKTTLDTYSKELDIIIENVEFKVDDIIGRFLIYECPICKKFYRYTYKDIETIIRINMTKEALLAIAMRQMKNMTYIRGSVLIYCGKCTGFDGNGSCTKKIYDNCKIKRLPYVI